MKLTLLIVLLMGYPIYANGQEYCFPSPIENSRPDTITTYLFSHGNSIKASKISKAKPISNFSFRIHKSTLDWMKVDAPDINWFIDMFFKNIGKGQIFDTLTCKVLGQHYLAIAIQYRRKVMLFMYESQKGPQDIFFAFVKNKNRIQDTLDFMSANLQEIKLD